MNAAGGLANKSLEILEHHTSKKLYMGFQASQNLIQIYYVDIADRSTTMFPKYVLL